MDHLLFVFYLYTGYAQTVLPSKISETNTIIVNLWFSCRRSKKITLQNIERGIANMYIPRKSYETSLIRILNKILLLKTKLFFLDRMNKIQNHGIFPVCWPSKFHEQQQIQFSFSAIERIPYICVGFPQKTKILLTNFTQEFHTMKMCLYSYQQFTLKIKLSFGGFA